MLKMDEQDMKVIRALSGGIPIDARPFAKLAADAGITESEFLSRMARMKDEHKLRRIGTVLHHRKAGFSANALCVWQVPPESCDDIGKAVSADPSVSHCYTRSTSKDWPYNFYVMIHASSRKVLEETADRLAAENGLGRRLTFYSIREWKKSSMKYS